MIKTGPYKYRDRFSGRIALRFCYTFFFILVVTTSCKKETTAVANKPSYPPAQVDTGATFTNPLLPSGPDPWVIQKDSFYYYTHTLANRIALYKTKDISQLKDAVKKVVWGPQASTPNAMNIWAPELHYLDGKWYLYYTAGASPDLSTQRSFVLENSSANPLEGTWIDKGKIADPNADFFAIDGTVLEYNAKRYFIWSGHATATDDTQRLYIARMANPWTLETPRVLISSPIYAWEQIGLPNVNEGPEALKNSKGNLFLTYSASGCWTDDYALGLLSLKEGGDPLNAADWTKSPNPVFAKKPESSAYGPGHNGFFKSPDGTEDWIIYHANLNPGQGCGDARNPRMQQFTWNADGTPNFGEPVQVYTKIRKPAGE